MNETVSPPEPEIASPSHWETIAALLAQDSPDPEALAALLATLTATETAFAVSRLPEAERANLLHVLSSDQGAALIQEINPEQAAEILEDISPALASGPILTTCTDMCGFFLVLSLATLALDHLPTA